MADPGDGHLTTNGGKILGLGKTVEECGFEDYGDLVVVGRFTGGGFAGDGKGGFGGGVAGEGWFVEGRGCGATSLLGTPATGVGFREDRWQRLRGIREDTVGAMVSLLVFARRWVALRR